MNLFTLKSCCAAALACCAALPAMAQSNVTMYGVLDVFAEYGKGDDTTYKLQSGGLSGSRLGFKGTEDLGDGLKALFQLETGFAADTGTTTQGGVFFGRQALVGIGGAFGTLSAGRQYTPHFLALDNDDPFGTGAGSAISSGIVSLLAVRANNSIAYEAPKMGAFSFNLLGAAGEGAGPRTVSGSARYAAGPVSVGLAFVQQNTAATARAVSLSGSYNFGVLSVTGGVQTVKNLTGALNTEDDRREFFGGVLVPMGQGVVSVGMGSGKTLDVSGTHATQWTAGYTYNLSKRTSLYGLYTAINNDTGTAYSADTATAAGPAVSAGHDVRALQVGLRHRF